MNVVILDEQANAKVYLMKLLLQKVCIMTAFKLLYMMAFC